jgi:hypothetical protein
MPRDNQFKRFRIAAEYLVLFALAGIFLWRGFLPAWRTLNTDFPDYYLAARLYHQGYPLEQVYDWTWIQRQKDHAGIDRPIVTFTLLTPFSLLPVLPLSSLPALEAKHAWLLANLVFLGLIGFLLCRMSRLGARRVALIMLLAMVPLRTNFLFGQEYVFLLLLITLAAWLYLRDKPVASGLVLAVASALKIYPGLFLLFFARKRRWRAALSLVLGSIAFWVLSIALFGFETVRVYIQEVLPWPLRGEGQDPYNVNWNSFSALLHRLFVAEPDLNPHPFVHAPAVYAILQPVCQGLIFVPLMWLMTSRPSGAGREKLEWGAFLAMLLMLSTNPSSYDFNALILVAVFIVGHLMERGRRWLAAGMLVLYALVCYPTYWWVPGDITGWHIVLAFPRLWSMTLLWISLLAVLSDATPPPQRAKLRSQAVPFGVLWLVLVVLGAGLNLVQLRHEFENYASRLMSAPEVFLATDPTVAGHTVLFTAMTEAGYGTAAFVQGSPRLLDLPADSFHSASAPGSEVAWTELASARSRVIQFSLEREGAPPLGETIEAEDAEKPAVSPDRSWLAFIRETKGRGALWVKPLAQASSDVGTERRLSPADLDVLDIAFDSEAGIIFSARRGGQPMLFTTGPQSGTIVALPFRSPRRYAAASPDGRWLAFSERERSNWQIGIEDRATHAVRQLTHSECNSIAPAWYPDSRHIVYASDCARGYGLTALCRIQAIP